MDYNQVKKNNILMLIFKNALIIIQKNRKFFLYVHNQLRLQFFKQ